jgi:hypothetical protein
MVLYSTAQFLGNAQCILVPCQKDRPPLLNQPTNQPIQSTSHPTQSTNHPTHWSNRTRPTNQSKQPMQHTNQMELSPSWEEKFILILSSPPDLVNIQVCSIHWHSLQKLINVLSGTGIRASIKNLLLGPKTNGKNEILNFLPHPQVQIR